MGAALKVLALADRVGPGMTALLDDLTAPTLGVLDVLQNPLDSAHSSRCAVALAGVAYSAETSFTELHQTAQKTSRVTFGDARPQFVLDRPMTCPRLHGQVRRGRLGQMRDQPRRGQGSGTPRNNVPQIGD